MARGTEGLDAPTKKETDRLKSLEQNQSEYPYNKIFKSKIGHTVELNETEGNEYINVRHGLTGAFIKMDAEGNVFIVTPNDINVESAKKLNVKCGTTLDKKNKSKSDHMCINVIGNAHVEVEGDMEFHVKGDRHDKVDGEYFITVGKQFVTTAPDAQYKVTGQFNVDANKYITTAATTECNAKKGGTQSINVNGTFEINQLSPGGVLKLSSKGDMEIETLGHIRCKSLSNLTFNIAGKVAYNIAGLRVIGTPTGVPQGPLSPFESSFEVNALQGAVRMNATLGVAQYFAGGPYLDVDCLTGVYLN